MKAGGPALDAPTGAAAIAAPLHAGRRLHRAWLLAPLGALAAWVAALGVDVAFGDELHYVTLIKAFREGGDWWTLLWLQHNEHRVVPLKLLILAGLGPTHWDQRLEMLCSVALTAVLAIVLLRLHRAAWVGPGLARPLAALPLVLLACSLAQYENQLYGLMVVHYFTAAGAVVAFYLLGRSEWWSTPLAAVAAVVASSSLANGLLVFPLGLVVLAAQRRHAWRWIFWCATGLVTTLLAFRHYDRPPHTRPFEWTAIGALKVVKLALCTTGAPLGAGSPYWALVLGAVVWAVALLLLWRWWRAVAPARAASASATAILLFGLGSSAMVGVGRAFLVAPGNPVQPRYVTHANLAWYGVVLLLPLLAGTRAFATLRSATDVVLALGLLAANVYGARSAIEWHRDRLVDQYVTRTYRQQPDAVLVRLGPPEVVRERLAYLEKAGLSAFSGPIRPYEPPGRHDQAR
ncbi:MAG TPA: hypothetical protein VFS60_10945 [Thermoanaerobaculia bacterium]|nr:hypothetical protein [Thermoanaerobaculia bacterium]